MSKSGILGTEHLLLSLSIKKIFKSYCQGCGHGLTDDSLVNYGTIKTNQKLGKTFDFSLINN